MCLQVKESDVNEDDEVDIVTVEKNSDFSDSDMSQEELCFLPAIPSPDVPEQQDKCIESSSKLVDSNHSGSPLSDDAGPNGRTTNHASSPLEGKLMPFYVFFCLSCLAIGKVMIMDWVSNCLWIMIISLNSTLLVIRI